MKNSQIFQKKKDFSNEILKKSLIEKNKFEINFLLLDFDAEI